MSTRKLEGKVAVVTGASKGIGAAIAKHLAAEGAAVVVNYSSSKDGAERVVGDIKGSGGRAVAVKADVAKKADIDQLFAETKKAYGPIDILVNNAGIYEFSPVEDITEEHFRKQFDLNVLGLTLTTQAALRQFNRRERDAQAGRSPDTVGPHWPASGHRYGGRLLRISGLGVDHGRDIDCRGRISLIENL